jgi:hypothetical protein
MGATKLDLTKKYKTYYTARTIPEVVEFEEAQFLTIQGKGAPQSDEFMAKLEALYLLAYGIKMPMKKEGKDFTVAKLEGLWWVESNKPFMEVLVSNGNGNFLFVCRNLSHKKFLRGQKAKL